MVHLLIEIQFIGLALHCHWITVLSFHFDGN